VAEPYVLITPGQNYHTIIDGMLVYSVKELSVAIIDIMCYFYIFNLEYPKNVIYFIFGLKDNKRLPSSLISFCTRLN
jgi:hypothetical protein